MTARRLLIDAMLDCLREIRIDEGYMTDAGAYVDDEPGTLTMDNLADGQEGVIAVFIERQEPATDDAVVRTHRLTTVTVVATILASQDNAQERIDAIVDDIERCIEGQQQLFPKGISYPKYRGMEPIQRAAGTNYVGAVVRWQTHIPKR